MCRCMTIHLGVTVMSESVCLGHGLLIVVMH